jgi:hypothetical protein
MNYFASHGTGERAPGTAGIPVLFNVLAPIWLRHDARRTPCAPKRHAPEAIA